MKDYKSVRTFIPVIFMAFLSSVVLLFNAMSIYLLYMSCRNINISNQTMLEYFGRTQERIMENTENFLINILGRDGNYFNMAYGQSRLEVYVGMKELTNTFRSSPMLENLSMFFVYNLNEDISMEVYSADSVLDYSTKNMRTEALKDWLAAGEDVKRGWFPVKLGENNSYVCVYGQKGKYIGAVIDVNKMLFELPEDAFHMEYLVSYCGDDGSILIHQEEFAEKQIEVVPGSEIRISGTWKKPYLVLSHSLDYKDANIVLALPVSRLLGSVPVIVLLMLCFSVGTIALLPLSGKFMKRYLVVPFNLLSDIIRKLENQEPIEEMPSYDFEEFQAVQNALVGMVEKIKTLTEEAVVQKFEKESAQLNYYRTQIKPHFFLNCLKNVYALTAQNKNRECQELVLKLSEYFRYIFKDVFSNVELGEELHQIENYVAILNSSSLFQIELKIRVDKELYRIKILPFILHTFIENATKHGCGFPEKLIITLKVMEARVEDKQFLNITIDNSGPVFEEDILLLLNKKGEELYKQGHVGIWNVKRQLLLYYGEDAQVVFYNLNSGKATVKLIVPMLEEEKIENA